MFLLDRKSLYWTEKKYVQTEEREEEHGKENDVSQQINAPSEEQEQSVKSNHKKKNENMERKQHMTKNTQKKV